uniref:Uncharacterized protein n=1 Tax=Klebsiella pneumoniae TaxID=573 RepID=A0A6M3HFN2_KLEPN|nr:hypothetical protein [Klebsiella pneumoniae]
MKYPMRDRLLMQPFLCPVKGMEALRAGSPAAQRG